MSWPAKARSVVGHADQPGHFPPHAFARNAEDEALHQLPGGFRIVGRVALEAERELVDEKAAFGLVNGRGDEG